MLPSRELTLAAALGVSRQWEQQRLRLLYALAQGRVTVLVASLDALLLRTCLLYTSHWLAFSRRLSTMARFMPILLANVRLRATEPTSGETTTISSGCSNLDI